jgi:hypothetical protein
MGSVAGLVTVDGVLVLFRVFVEFFSFCFELFEASVGIDEHGLSSESRQGSCEYIFSVVADVEF